MSAVKRRHRQGKDQGADPGAPWRIIDIELTEPLSRLDRPEGAAAWFAVFRFEGAVIGDSVISSNVCPLEADVLAARARAATGVMTSRLLALLASDEFSEPAWTPKRARTAVAPLNPFDFDTGARLKEAIAARRKRPIEVSASIVICTRGRPAALRECLRSIDSERAKGREIVVVDNGPDPETKAVASALEGVRYVVEPEPGLNRARNAGLAAATSDVAAFIDDDVRPEPGWLEPLLQCFDEDHVAVVCGLVLPYKLETEAEIYFQRKLGFGGMGYVPLRFDREFITDWPIAAPVSDVGAGASMAVRRDAVSRLGPFDVRIGAGAAGGCGDDSEYWNRALVEGLTIRYEPLSVARHQHRDDWPGLVRQARGYAFGFVVAQLAQHQRHGDRRNWREVYARRPMYFLRRLVRAPDRWLRGRPDRMLFTQIGGYISGLRAARRVLGQPADVHKG